MSTSTSPNEETGLLTAPRSTAEVVDEDAIAFRSVKHASKWRPVVFVMETIVLMVLYGWLLQSQVETSTFQLYLLLSYGLIYMLRLNLMALWLLPRALAIEELIIVMLIWLPLILISFAMLSRNKSNLVSIVASMVLYVLGSFLNTYSELERKLWKQDPEHQGKCYTEGLFALSRNINYFGDVLLFAGWAVATANWWNLWVPIVTGLLFYYYHIPNKESYLAIRYKDEWRDYAKSTKSFIPFVV